MEETIIVIMEKNKQTGFLESEIASFKIVENEVFLVNAYAEKENDSYIVHVKISCDKEVEDWEFQAIYDYYDMEKLKLAPGVLNAWEVEDCYNPTWEITFLLENNAPTPEEIIRQVLGEHRKELYSVYQVIADKKSDYEMSE